MTPDKYGLAAALRESATLGELTGANPFQCRALEQAARTLEALDGAPEEWLASGALAGIKGIGKGMIDRVREWAETGRLSDLEKLRAQVPPGLPELLAIPSLGPKKVGQLWKERGVDSLDKLEAAAKAGALAGLAGFGDKTVAKLLAGIAQRREYSARHLVDEALEAAERVRERLAAVLPPGARLELAGSLRRRRETVKDLDFLVAADGPTEPIMEAFVTTPGARQVVAHGTTKSSIVLETGIPVDLRVVAPGQMAAALQYFTGSKEHNTELRGRAKRLGLKLNEYGLYPEGSETPLPTPDEASIYARLGLAYIEPELREGRGEIEAAGAAEAAHANGGSGAGALPDLIRPEDLAGLPHCHTTWSDGKASVEEMARACQAMGYRYMVICDHSQSAFYAGGLKPDQLARQSDMIDEINARLEGFRVFKGVESDILEHGALDYPDDVLARLDMVVAAIHSRMGMTREAMTERICRALEHPATRVLAHPTGRLLLRREPYDVDMEKILATAAERGVAVEINAHPMRLDLDWTWLRRAKQMGCRFAICPDAHSIQDLELAARYGVAVARKGWLARADVVNCLEPDAFGRWLAARP